MVSGVYVQTQTQTLTLTEELFVDDVDISVWFGYKALN